MILIAAQRIAVAEMRRRKYNLAARPFGLMAVALRAATRPRRGLVQATLPGALTLPASTVEANAL